MPIAEANAEKAAFRKCIVGVDDVIASVAAALAVVPRVEKRPAVGAIARTEHGDKTENDNYGNNDGKNADRKLAVPQHRKYRHDADHRGAQV